MPVVVDDFGDLFSSDFNKILGVYCIISNQVSLLYYYLPSDLIFSAKLLRFMFEMCTCEIARCLTSSIPANY